VNSGNALSAIKIIDLSCLLLSLLLNQNSCDYRHLQY